MDQHEIGVDDIFHAARQIDPVAVLEDEDAFRHRAIAPRLRRRALRRAEARADLGHAVLVVDTAHGDDGTAVFLLAQSYMPAQQIHVLANPKDPELSPWYRYDPAKGVGTPELYFTEWMLRRFPKDWPPF